MTPEKDHDAWLTTELAASRPHLLGVAYRMLSSRAEAEDAVQEACLRVQRADAASLENPRGWLTTVVARVCLDMLRSRKARPEQPTEPDTELTLADATAAANPEHETLLADSVGVALMVLLDTLTPNERLAFVLHDSFDLSFEEIAVVLTTTPAAARQLASRARRRVQGASAKDEAGDPERQRQVVQAFLVASRTGDLAGLLAVLHPDVQLRADASAIAESQRRKSEGAPQFVATTQGAAVVAQTFLGRASAAQTALVNGRMAAVWAPAGTPRAALLMTIVNDRIIAIEIVADPAELAAFEISWQK